MNPVSGWGVGMLELIVIAMILGVLLVFAAIPAVLGYIVLSRIPTQFRKQEPALAFLLLIPLFSIVWNFFVHPKVAESLEAYYEVQGDRTKGDCGASLALWLRVCGVCAFIPLFGLFAGVAGVVLLIIFYAKAFDLSAGIPKAT